jgi:hypothetical protein
MLIILIPIYYSLVGWAFLGLSLLYGWVFASIAVVILPLSLGLVLLCIH